tara:strand:- start:79195 stop:82098 length:2904 start_codon:yes stop_codon:yes gene_type:complete
VQLAKHKTSKSKEKILLVLDYMPTEDLKSGRILSGATGTLLKRILQVSNQFYGEERTLDSYNWLAVSYHAFKTSGESPAFKEGAHKEFRKRLNHIIAEYKPDTVITFGPDPYKALNGTKINEYNGKLHHLFGVPTPTTIKHKGEKHKFKHVPSLSLNTLVNDAGKGSEMALAGYVARNLVNGLHGKLKYRIPKRPDYQTTLIDTVEKFDKMLKKLLRAKYVAIDTETENLNRRANRMLTLQFACSTKRAFVLPYFHKDSPFTAQELEYIAKKLRKFFEVKNENKYHVFANATFDLTVLRKNLGIRYFKTQVWDLFAAEFALDENMKFLSGVTGHYYYSLLNLSMQYGCPAYYEAEFGKENRKTIVSADLNDALLEYCSLDVVIPLHIMRVQMERAADIEYEKYESIVSEQISDMLHSFSTFEYNGAYTDIEYLFYLKTKDSPIRAEMLKIEERLKNTKGVQKANKILSKKKGAPTVGLWGKSTFDLFDIGKQDHQRLLFFDILKLKPLQKGKSGHGKIDKKFQEKYSDVEEVKLYSELQKAKKLFNAYVKSFIKNWGEDEDMRFDRRIRPHFKFLDVVTGRTSAQKPSLHQIPSRSELGKHIKRLFITEEGRIMIKVDYAAHEVRCWSLFTGDKDVANLFGKGMDMRQRYKLAPDPGLLKKIDLEGDVHKINASYFFGVPIEKVDKPIRNAVKQVIFGLIYQQGLKGLAESTGQPLAVIEKLVEQFKKKYPVGVSWFDDIKGFARNHLYVESPLGRRRHVWGLLIPDDAPNADSCKARNERQSVNSPIQGMGSDFLINGSRQIERLRFEHLQETGHYPDFYQANSVHDSIIFSCAIEDFWTAIKIIEEGLTAAVAEVSYERHGMEFHVPLEIDFEIGSNERDVEGWDYSMEHLSKIIKGTAKTHKEWEYKAKVKTMHDDIMYQQYDQMPDWAKKQCWNLGWKLKGMKKDPRSKKDKHKVVTERKKAA